jgi:gliding motility-associated-like protein
MSVAAIQAHGSLTFSGNSLKPVTISPEASTGLEAVYVVNSLNGVTATYTATSDATVTWYKYSNLGGGYAQEISNVSRSGRAYSLPLSGSGDMGYIIDEGTRRTCYWVVDYSHHQLSLESLNIAAEQECDVASLTPAGQGDKITYYTVTGIGKELDRELTLTYNSLTYDSDNSMYRQETVTRSMAYLPEEIHATAPLCDTEFTLSGDRFLKQWGQEQEVISPLYSAIAVAATTTAAQTERDNDNEKTDDSGSAMGGSGPVEVKFTAVPTDAAIFHEWQFSSYAEFDDIDTRYSENEITHTFNDSGTIYVRYMAANAEGTCEYYSETYEVFVGESKLECPNAFSPGASEGVNDLWKVSYKSIVDFECHIFNRWGVKMASFTDPSQGWDGKYNGKLVPSGVYYYVIKAKGSDGKNYKLSGDINIIKYKGSKSTGTTGDTE